MAPLLSLGTRFPPILTHGLLARSAHSSSHRRPSKVTLPQRARIRASPSGPCAIVSGLRQRLVMLFLPYSCCGRAPDRSAALTRSRLQSMVSRNAFCSRMFPRLPRASGLARHRYLSAPPTSPAASQPLLPARVPQSPCSQPARRRVFRCVPPLSPAGAAAAVRGAGQAR